MMFSMITIMLISVTMTDVMHAVKCKELTVEVGARTRVNAKSAVRADPRGTTVRRSRSAYMAQASTTWLREYQRRSSLQRECVTSIMMIKRD